MERAENSGSSAAHCPGSTGADSSVRLAVAAVGMKLPTAAKEGSGGSPGLSGTKRSKGAGRAHGGAEGRGSSRGWTGSVAVAARHPCMAQRSCATREPQDPLSGHGRAGASSMHGSKVAVGTAGRLTVGSAGRLMVGNAGRLEGGSAGNVGPGRWGTSTVSRPHPLLPPQYASADSLPMVLSLGELRPHRRSQTRRGVQSENFARREVNRPEAQTTLTGYGGRADEQLPGAIRARQATAAKAYRYFLGAGPILISRVQTGRQSVLCPHRQQSQSSRILLV